MRDIVGLYLNPPEHALVLCVDEKSPIQALERSQPLLPLGLGYVEGITHDTKRHGTTTLFAALDIATDEVMTPCKPRHRHQEFLQFLRHIEDNVPATSTCMSWSTITAPTSMTRSSDGWLVAPGFTFTTPPSMLRGSTRWRLGPTSLPARRFDIRSVKYPSSSSAERYTAHPMHTRRVDGYGRFHPCENQKTL